jgi:carboxyl-terminal processing protease
VILVNGLSASASEIVAGAIQDLDRGVIMGETTYGKGLVQTVVSLTRDSALKITTAKYYVPSGRCIQKEQPHPDEQGDLLASAAEDEELTDVRVEAESSKAVGKNEKTSSEIFRTKNGREVYGGGGIKPDIETLNQKLNRFESTLRRKAMTFNFAVTYASKHPTAKEREFRIDDSVVAEFRQFLRDKKFTYTSQSELQLAELKKTAESEGYLADLQPSLTTLEQALQHEKDDDFTKSEDFIRHELEREIAGKLFGSKSQVEVTFDDDPAIMKALEILQAADSYNAILSGTKVR